MKWVVDCHVHTCFLTPEQAARERKCHAFLDAFEASGVDAVIVTEHAWRSYRTAFDQLTAAQTRSSNWNTLLIPGVEGYTKEGVDIILYGESPEFYEALVEIGLSKPKELSLTEVVRIAEAEPRIGYFLPHPRGLSNTAVLNNRATKDLGLPLHRVEKINGSFGMLSTALGRAGRFLPSKTVSRVEEAYCYDHQPDQQIFAGSDAHHPSDINSIHCLSIEVEEKPKTVAEGFALLRDGVDRSWRVEREGFSFSRVCSQGLTTFVEFLLKHSNLSRRQRSGGDK